MTPERIDKTLRGLRACATGPQWYEDCQKAQCPYIDDSAPGNMDCTNMLAFDALGLLKSLAWGHTDLEAIRGALGGGEA